MTSTSRSQRPDVIVCGLGVAGIACALRLAQHGLRVHALESRKKVGGRASSFTDPRTGEELDNCQHVALGCCTSYLDLLSRLDRADALEWYDQQHWVEPGGRVSTLSPAAWLPVPAQMGPSLLSASFVSTEDLTLLAVGAARVLFAARDRWRGRTFREFLGAADQPPELVSKFWEPVVVSACNVTSDRACAALALKVFQEGLLAGPQAARIGVPRVPLGRLYERLTPAVALAGGTVELGVSVSQIGVGAVRLDDGRELAAPCIVCALPFERAIHVLDEPAQTGRLAQLKGLQRLGHSPILGVHLSFDRPVIHLPHAVLVGGATQWLFRKDQAGTRVHAVISAADGWTDLTEEQIVARVMGDLRAYFPAQFLGHGPAPSLVHARAVKERRATFVPAPGVERLRPAVALPESARAGRNEVLLAGCYTNTGWPSTMEGATRSGYEAAGWVLGQDLSVPDLEPAPVMRVLRTVW